LTPRRGGHQALRGARRRLRFAGFVTVPARHDEEPERASGEIEHAGKLARLEFQRM
jgi:hypothetical protein